MADFQFTNAFATVPTEFQDTSLGIIVGWEWDFSDGVLSNLQNPSHVFALPGTYPVSLEATDNFGGVTPITKQVVVGSQPQPNALSKPRADFTASAQSGNAPLTVNFADASYGSIANRVWSFGDGVVSYEKNPTHIFESGNFAVTLTVMNESGSSTKSYRIDVSPPPSPVLSDYAETILDLIPSIRGNLQRPSDMKLPYQDIIDTLNDLLRGYSRDLNVSEQDLRTDEGECALNWLEGNNWLLTLPNIKDVEPMQLSFLTDDQVNQTSKFWQTTTIAPLDYFIERHTKDFAVASFYGGAILENGIKVKLNLPKETVEKSVWRLRYKTPILKLLKLNDRTPLPPDFLPMLKIEATVLVLPKIRDNSKEFYAWRNANMPIWESQIMDWRKRWKDLLNTNNHPTTLPKTSWNEWRRKSRRQNTDRIEVQ